MKTISDFVIYGAGKRGKRCLRYAIQQHINISFFVDRKIAGLKIDGVEVKNVDAVKDYCGIVVISVMNEEEEIKEELISKQGIEKCNVITYKEFITYIITNGYNNLSALPKEFNAFHTIYLGISDGQRFGGVETWNLAVCELLNKYHKKVEYALVNSEIDGLSQTENTINISLPSDKEMFDVEVVEYLVTQLIDHLPCSIVTSRMDCILAAGYVLKKLYPDKVKLVAVIHGGRDIFLKDWSEFTNIVDHYIGVSEKWICKKIIEDYGVEKNKVSYFTLPIIAQPQLVRSYSDESEPLKIGFASRIELRDLDKRVDLLIPLIKKLVKEKINFVVNIAGNGDYLDTLIEEIRENNFECNTNVHGWIKQKEMCNFWKENDIHLSLSDSEGNSLAKLEAMSCGCVPILTDVSGTRDSVIDGYNGFIVKPGDLDGMVNCIKYLHDNRFAIYQMGMRSYKVIEENYCEEVLIDKLLTAINL